MGTWMQQMKQHGAILADITKHLGLQRSSEPHGSNTTNTNTTNPPVGENSVEVSTMNESRLAGKKVKLPLFDGDDPVA
ncbi:hypothetical protein A2U01_0080812, partial [Trifolium medium]|nr:hypothetical protein [Trifolium medium]